MISKKYMSVDIPEGFHSIETSLEGQGNQLSTYVLKSDTSIIFDPGPASTVTKVINSLKASKIKSSDPLYVALSHIHLDHAGGSWRLLDTFHEAIIYVHPRGQQHIIDPSKLVEASRNLLGKEVVDGYGEIHRIKSDRVRQSEDLESLDLGELSIRVIWTPGHANHHQVFFIPEFKILILGDAGGLYDHKTGKIFPTTPPPFNPPKAIESLDKLISLNPEVVCYSHSGFTSEGEEKLLMYKEQIELWNTITENGLKENLSPEKIFNRIKDMDPMLDEYKQGISTHLTSLNGFIRYHEWMRNR